MMKRLAKTRKKINNDIILLPWQNIFEVDQQYTYFLRILNLISEFKGLCMFSSRSL